jgi:S1-C subfamily serine protease
METDKPGLNIITVIPGSPAVKAGIKPGDRLIAINGKPINNVEDYSEASKEWAPTRVYDIVRGNQLLTLTLHFPERDDKPVNHAEIIALLQEKEGKPN